MRTTFPVTLDQPWSDFLRDVEAALSRRVHLHCVGGFVLTALYDIPRITGDLDYVEVIPRDAVKDIEAAGGRASAAAKKHRIFMQHAGGIVDLPEEYQDRVQELGLNLRRLRLWVLEPYDLLLSKLPRNSPKDREDAKFLARKLNLKFAVFHARWEKEMARWIANRERHEVTMKLWNEYFPA